MTKDGVQIDSLAGALEFAAEKCQNASDRQITLQDPNSKQNLPFVLLRDTNGSERLEQVSFKADQRPDRVRANFMAEDVDSFIDYVNERKTNHTRIFANIPDVLLSAPVTITAILDFHPAKGTDWCSHLVQLKLSLSKEFQEWLAISGKFMPQAQFSEFILEHRQDVVKPDGATMIELAQTIEGTVGAKFKGRHIDQNGAVTLLYDETVEGRAGKEGNLEIPPTITLMVMPFLRSVPIPYQVDLRYRLDKPSIALGIVMRRVEKMLQDCVLGVMETIAEKVGVPCFNGRIANQ